MMATPYQVAQAKRIMKRRVLRQTKCLTCTHWRASHHCLGKCKQLGCKCTRFVTLKKRA